MPFVSTLDCGQGPVAIEGERSVGRIWPGNNGVQMLDDLPMGKEKLGLLGAGVERVYDKARGFEFYGKCAGLHGRYWLRKILFAYFLDFGCDRCIGALHAGLCELAVAGLPAGMGFGADRGGLGRLVGAVVGDCEIFAV